MTSLNKFNEPLDITEEILTFNSKELNLPDFDQTPPHFLIQNNFHDFSDPCQMSPSFLFPITYDDSYAKHVFLEPDGDSEGFFELSGMLSNSSDYLNNVDLPKDISENPDYVELKQRIEKRRKDDPYGFLKQEYDSRFWPGRKTKSNQESPKQSDSAKSVPGSPSNFPSNQRLRINKPSELSPRKESTDILKTLLQAKEPTPRSNMFKISLPLSKKPQPPENSIVQVSLIHATILVDKRKIYRPLFEETPDQFPALHFASFHGDTHCPFERPPQNVENYIRNQKKICENKRTQILNPKLPSPGAMTLNFCELCRVKFKDAKIHHESELHKSRVRSNIWDKIDHIAATCNQSFVKNFPIEEEKHNS